MDNRSVGIFDSGLGGLTAFSALRERLPDENLIYFGDSGRAPYGGRPEEQLRRMARQNLAFMQQQDVKAVLVACGTLSSIARDILAESSIKAVGVIDATVLAASRLAGSAPIGIIATAASIRSGTFEARMRELCPKNRILPVACPDFVPLIEGGHIQAEDPAVREAVQRYLQPIKEAGAGTLILGCTHYGILSQAITDYLGPEVELVEASRCAAEDIADYLEGYHLCGSDGREEFYTSGSAGEFSALGSLLTGRPVDARHIPPQEA